MPDTKANVGIPPDATKTSTFNTIWRMQNGEGEEANNFEDLGKLELEHFGDVYKEDSKATIVEVVKMTTFLPRFVNDMSNESLMEEVAKEDLQVVLHSFQKIKVHDQTVGLQNSFWVFVI
jgi:hypothetical protein